MFLTKPQKYLLEILQQLEAIREEQEKQILLGKFTEIRMDQQLRQLVYGGLIRWENGVVSIPEGAFHSEAADAVDIMLLMEPNHVPLFQKGTYPFSLTFF